jgi:ribulose-5-phosphate 4-epimerase/fuculose-1-phosphate aldolase
MALTDSTPALVSALGDLPREPPAPSSGWVPRATPPIGVELTNEQKLACSFRVLAGTGFSENMAGHITWADRADGSLLINPWGLWWDEVKGSDVCRVDPDGRVVEGRWDVTPAYHIHTELHRRRPDARVVVHNHPYYVTVLAAVGVLPQIAHQTGALYDDDLSLVHEYTGEVDDAAAGAQLAETIGDCNTVILASHGIIVTADTVELATYRASMIDRFCRLAYDVMLLGRDPLPISKSIRSAMQKALIERAADVHWAGSVRRLVREQPDVLL